MAGTDATLLWLVPLITTFAGAIFALGRLWQKQVDHERNDTEKFEAVNRMLMEMRSDIKTLMQRP